jgi:hypothetical protein
MNNSTYRDPITKQYVFINAITGKKTHGTDWGYERRMQMKEEQYVEQEPLIIENEDGELIANPDYEE